MNGVHVRVRAGGEHYALPVEGVREIAKVGPLTPVPGAPITVLGMWNLRGEVMVVIDLARELGLESRAELERIVVTEESGHRAGLAVESVVDVGLLSESLEPTDSVNLHGMVLIDRTPIGIVDLDTVLHALSPKAL